MGKSKIDTSLNCYHCGEKCEDTVIEFEEKNFCCQGCQLVFEILNENDMCTYYNIESSPGIKVSGNEKDEFKHLDHPDIKKSLLEFSEGNISKVKLYIPKIHCSSCIWLLENLQKLNPGILHSQVDFLKKRVYITFDHSIIELRGVVELLNAIGYTPKITREGEKEEQADKSFFYKLGIAGFAFGNIMLLSFPDYLDQNQLLTDEYQSLFGYINLILALPVSFYSASDYFVSAFKALKTKYVNIDLPISLGIIALFSRSVYDILTHSGTGFMDSFAMFVFLLLVGKWYQNRTYKALAFDRDYKSYFPIAITKIENGIEENVPLEEVKVGDIVVIKNQEIIPSDSVLKSKSARIDYSFVTGESLPVEKNKAELVYAGGRLIGGKALLEIKKPVEQSYLTRLWNQDAFKSNQSKANLIIDKVSKRFTIAVIAIAVLTFSYWIRIDSVMAVNAFTAVLIIACPCALALTIPFTMGNMMRIFGKRKFFVKNTDTIENMAKLSAIVFDKTGTITKSEKASVKFNGALSQDEKSLIASLSKQSSHPLSRFIYSYLNLKEEPVEEFEEYTGRGIVGRVDNKWIKLGSADFVGLRKNGNTSPLISNVFVSIDAEVIGFFEIKKQFRPGLKGLINSLKNNFQLFLLSGDNDADKSFLSKIFGNRNNLSFNQSPTDKLKKIKLLQSEGQHVMMIGDGLNDAGALKQSEVGVAISDDVYNFTPACDAILASERLMSLPTFITASKQAMKVVKASFIISLSYNAIGLFFAVQGKITPLFAAVLMPLSSISVVGFITLATYWIQSKKVAD